jgi:hypothetical protein
VKPFRGKRRGPQSLPVGFNPSAVRPARRRIREERDGRCYRAVDGCTFGGRSATTGSSAVRSSRGRWPRPQGFGVIDPGGVGPLADRGRLHRAVGRGSAAPCVRSNCGDCRQCPLAASARWWWMPEAGSGSVANRSVTCPTRLETRTKESNMCASQWVLRNLEAK